VLLGDVLSYGMGRLLRRPIEKRLWSVGDLAARRTIFRAARRHRDLPDALRPDADRCPDQSDRRKQRLRARALCGLDAAGELVWLLLWRACYFFGSQWNMSRSDQQCQRLLVGLLIAVWAPMRSFAGIAARRPHQACRPTDRHPHSLHITS